MATSTPCPFAIHENFLAGNVREEGGFARVWPESALFAELRSPQSGGGCASCGHFDAWRGGCMAAKFFPGLPLDGPDPECVRGFGEAALTGPATAPQLRRSPTSTTRTPVRSAAGHAARYAAIPAKPGSTDRLVW